MRRTMSASPLSVILLGAFVASSDFMIRADAALASPGIDSASSSRASRIPISKPQLQVGRQSRKSSIIRPRQRVLAKGRTNINGRRNAPRRIPSIISHGQRTGANGKPSVISYGGRAGVNGKPYSVKPGDKRYDINRKNKEKYKKKNKGY
jgi:hypothetical protein